MAWLGISILAQFILGTSAVFDKILLKRSFFDPWVYTFWAGVLGGLGIVLIPFGFVKLPLLIIFLAIAAGALFTFATLFFFLALHKSEASVALPVIGALTPIFTFLISLEILSWRLTGAEIFGALALVLGGLFFLSAERPEFRLITFSLALASAALFGLSNVLTKLVFEAGPFITGFVWMRVGGVLGALALLASPGIRRNLPLATRGGEISNKFFYLLNRGYAAGGVALINVAIFLNHPALVDATNSLKYVVIFFTAWFLLSESFRGRVLVIKLIAVSLIAFGLVSLGLVTYAKNLKYDPGREIKWGVTFSTKMARQLGLDPRAAFEGVLDELKPERLRLIAYWDEVEPEKGKYDFSELDWQISRASVAHAQVVLAVGMKLPRWPECHFPRWLSGEFPISNFQFPKEKEEELLKYISTVVERYRDQPAITMWQVENEPFLAFGQCPDRPSGLLEKEVSLVKSLDPSRPVLVTDGGEFGDWYRAAKAGDIFGTTIYRKVYPRFVGPVLGVIEYPFSPSYFRFKERVVRGLTVGEEKYFLVSELQAEPWGGVELHLLPLEDQLRIFPPEYFKETLEYAREAGFDEYYLWGAEWWYWLKEKHDKPEMWEIAKSLLNP